MERNPKKRCQENQRKKALNFHNFLDSLKITATSSKRKNNTRLRSISRAHISTANLKVLRVNLEEVCIFANDSGANPTVGTVFLHNDNFG